MYSNRPNTFSMYTAHCFLYYFTYTRLPEQDYFGPIFLLMELIEAYPRDAVEFLVSFIRSHPDDFPRDLLRALARSMRRRFNTGAITHALMDFSNTIVSATNVEGLFSRAELALPVSEAFIPSAILGCHRQVCSAPPIHAIYSIRILVDNLMWVLGRSSMLYSTRNSLLNVFSQVVDRS